MDVELKAPEMGKIQVFRIEPCEGEIFPAGLYDANPEPTAVYGMIIERNKSRRPEDDYYVAYDYDGKLVCGKETEDTII